MEKEFKGTKAEKENLEALKLSFQVNEWEDFLLVLNEIRDRDKEIKSMYRKQNIELKKSLENYHKLEAENARMKNFMEKMSKSSIGHIDNHTKRGLHGAFSNLVADCREILETLEKNSKDE